MMERANSFDVIVIGGGHAGAEAAAVAARMGASVALITMDPSKIGEMSCNPAIGGLGKGHLVREIDALGGIMGRAADMAGIHFKLLNRSKGPAVRGPRAQADRRLYREAIQRLLKEQGDISIIAGEVVDLDIRDASVNGCILGDGRRLSSKTMVLTTGTFLGGMIHIGRQTVSAGRVGESASNALAQRLRGLGLRIGRLKTGTPARLVGNTIDWTKCEMQPSDSDPEPFSVCTKSITNPQVACGITATTPETHRIVRENLSLSAMFSGNITGVGPRYCPSIEDKVSRFFDRESHQVFLEPEGLDDPLVYPNGISTSLPADVQERMIRSIPGLESVEIARSGYAIEYDYIDPRHLESSLELREIGCLFLAGQINGTTGYEEAAAQGLIAGLNAARLAAGLPCVTLGRADAYIGVMVSDLVRAGVSEPYRMFTSRAEYRLSLRADNADRRLTRLGIEWGIVRQEQASVFEERTKVLGEALALVSGVSMSPDAAQKAGLGVNRDGIRRTGFDLLAHPGIGWGDLCRIFPELAQVPAWAQEVVETDAKYSVYIDRQRDDIQRLERDRNITIDDGFDYGMISGLSNELRQRLTSARPRNLEEAQALEGMTPAALILILAALKRGGSQRIRVAS